MTIQETFVGEESGKQHTLHASSSMTSPESAYLKESVPFRRD